MSTLHAFSQIVARTRAVLEAVPEDRMDWRPHDRSWTLGEHVLSRADLFVIIELTNSGAAIPAE